ncbi:NAD-dependent epimerase/dehydratase family protein [Oceanirhabdus sp. W0125-5]|uniref:NAD-dependent epimerase/dehydratase family protein n=1 Tax=Oceanirhabdus sp. W0125-5 TaxID=2999116 RepID=UPI0022F2D7ED|nr:NAD-dependent epimerase/dehydratase family protein [Oceanirhabdus sp. W0125-5]WBW96727.1 NAD-dependent epimerase/dehydratase family protein [Oceanirhabdus sp. W0125-5]
MVYKKSEVLVMGGTEFVGRAAAKYLISQGYIVDIFTRGVKLVDYEGIRNHITGDRKSTEDLEKGLANMHYDFVFDISAYTKEDVKKLISVLDRSSIKRYVFCSSGAVYIPSEEIVSENYTRGENQNWGPYGLNKKEAEDYLFELYEKEKFPCTMFRPTYIYGEGNNLYREAYLFERITKGLDIPIPDGNTTTQFIHIDDLVRTFESALHCDTAIGQAYNITHPQIISWYDLVEAAIETVDKKIEIVKVSKTFMDKLNIKISRQFFPFRDVTYMLDIERLKEDGLYSPAITLKDGLKRAFKWYNDKNPDIKDLRMDKMELILENQ